jgi:hypothetical protein
MDGSLPICLLLCINNFYTLVFWEPARIYLFSILNMKKFFKKILIVLVGYLLVVQLINFFAPYHWGNPWYSSKIQFLENKNLEKEYNTFFFGSSRIYRQLDPKLIDSIVNQQSNVEINSFNLGAPATFCLQNYYLYEHFLNSELAANAKYTIIELNSANEIPRNRLNEERTYYYQNFPDLYFLYKYTLEDKKGFSFKSFSFLSGYFISYLEKIILPANLKHFMVSDDFYKEKYLGVDKRGYFSLEYDIKTTEDTIVLNNLLERKKELNVEELNHRKNEIQNDYLTGRGNYNKTHLAKIKYLISKSKEHGIHLFFLMSPRAVDEDIICLSKHIPSSNLLDFANPNEYELLYVKENSFDNGHLNNKGSIEYSNLFSKKFIGELSN